MDIDDKHEKCSQFGDNNEEDEQQSGGNHEDVDNLLTQNQKTAVEVPPTASENTADSDLAEVTKWCWVVESPIVPVMVRTAETLKM